MGEKSNREKIEGKIDLKKLNSYCNQWSLIEFQFRKKSTISKLSDNRGNLYVNWLFDNVENFFVTITLWLGVKKKNLCFLEAYDEVFAKEMKLCLGFAYDNPEG